MGSSEGSGVLKVSGVRALTSSFTSRLNQEDFIFNRPGVGKRVSELQALSRTVSFSSSAATVVYVPEFLAKTESAVRPLPRTFAIHSLSDFAAGLLDEMLLCPVRALSEYVARTSRFVDRPRRLFVSSRIPSRAMSKNGISYLLLEVIVHSGASSNDAAAPKAHSIRGIATSSSFFKN